MKKSFTQDELVALQVINEIGMKTNGVDRFNGINERAITGGSESETKWNKKIIRELTNPLAQFIQAYIDYYTGRPGKPSKSITYLKLLTPDQAAFITIKNILDSLTRSVEARQVAKMIGSRIEDQVRFAGVQASAPKYIDKVQKAIRQNHSKQYKHRSAKMAAAESSLIAGNKEKDIEGKKELIWTSWLEQDIIQLGSHLITIFAENVTLNGNAVIEKLLVRNNGGNKTRTKTILIPTEYMQDWIEKYKDAIEALSPMFAPCVIKPRDWTSPTNGGYHIKEIADTLPLVKCRRSQLNRLTVRQMPEVYSAINVLQAVEWQVVDRVYNVASRVRTLGLPYGMPSGVKLELPISPLEGQDYGDARGLELKAMMTEDEWSEFIMWKRNTTVIHTKEEKRKADFLRVVRTLAGAEQFKPYERVHFVYTMDFRGRVYAKSDSISPQGNDLQKGLIRFANGKPLGDRGYYWLAVHGSNVYGEDKLTFDDRVKIVENMKDDIRDIASDPMTFTSWKDADKPYQYLSWCFEWSDLMDHIEDGNDASTFISHLPIGMDGSCSGIQHYSAILRDPVGGAAVNLVPDDHPHDIYEDVASVSRDKFRTLTLEADEADKNGDMMLNPQAAQGWLDIQGGFNRKITKPPTMTIVYGSSHQTCGETTSQYLIDLQTKADNKAGGKAARVHPFAMTSSEPGVPRWRAEKLGTKVIWESLSEVIKAAKLCMKCIQDVAKEVAKSGHHLEIVAPTGFICEQREMDKTSKRVKTQLLGETYMTLATDTDNFNVRKMKTSSAPNFIHLHDAAHLIKIVNGFKQAGFDSIAVVHDDFGTHACDTEKARRILINTFVDMYSNNDVLADLKHTNEMAHEIEIETEVPEVMGLDLETVRKSTYIFG